MLIIAPLEVKCPRAFYLFGGAIINIRPRPPMYYSLNHPRVNNVLRASGPPNFPQRLLPLISTVTTATTSKSGSREPDLLFFTFMFKTEYLILF